MTSNENQSPVEPRAVGDVGGELAVPMADTPQDLQAAVVLAKQFPRDEEAACERILKACTRPAFAEAARYLYERDNTDVSGFSIVFAREAARLWSNVRYGFQITGDETERRKVMAWAWDLESNVRSFAEDVFVKKVPRRDHGRTVMKPANERELRELTAARASIMIRNAILTLLPPGVKEEAAIVCKATLTEQARKEGRADAVPAILETFGRFGVSKEQLEKHLGHPMAKITAEEVADLRSIARAIKDKTAKWSDYAKGAERGEPDYDGDEGENAAPQSALDAFEAALES